jgi:hypothetical protein
MMSTPASGLPPLLILGLAFLINGIENRVPFCFGIRSAIQIRAPDLPFPPQRHVPSGHRAGISALDSFWNLYGMLMQSA